MMLEMAEKLIKTESIENTYLIKEELGRGRFAVVRRCIRKVSGEEFAAKFIRKARAGRRGREQLLLEIDILHNSSHQKLVRLYDVFETKSEMILILEYAEGGDLHKHCLEQIDTVRTEKEICNLVRQIVEAVRYLHDHRVVHLDLKPENILLKTCDRKFPEVKLIDFGLSRRLDAPYSQFDIVGTPEYVAPEVLSYEPLEISADMWSIGVVTYVLLSGISPFAGDDVMETYGNISQVDFDFDAEEFDELSDDAKDFIECLLIKEPKERYTARETLEHPWLKQLEDGVTAEDIAAAIKADTLIPSDIESKTLELNPYEEEGLVEDLASDDDGLDDHEEETSEGHNEQDIELNESEVCTNHAEQINTHQDNLKHEYITSKVDEGKIKPETPDSTELIKETTEENAVLDTDKGKDFTSESIETNIHKEEIKSEAPETTKLVETTKESTNFTNKNESEENNDTRQSILIDKDEGFAVETIEIDKDAANLSTNDQGTTKNKKEDVSYNTNRSDSVSDVNNKVLADIESNSSRKGSFDSNSSKQSSTEEQIPQDVPSKFTKDSKSTNGINSNAEVVRKVKSKTPRSISLECKSDKRGSFAKVKERFESGGIYKERFGNTESVYRRRDSGETSPSVARKSDDKPKKVKSLESVLSEDNTNAPIISRQNSDKLSRRRDSGETSPSVARKLDDKPKKVKSLESVLSEDNTNSPIISRQNSDKLSRTDLQLKLENESPKAGQIVIKQGSLNKRKDDEKILLYGQPQTLHFVSNQGNVSPSSTPSSTPSSGSRTPDSGKATPTTGNRTPSSEGRTQIAPTLNGSRTPPLSSSGRSAPSTPDDRSSIKKPVGVRQGIAAQMASKFANLQNDKKISTPIKRPFSPSSRVSDKMKDQGDNKNHNGVKTPESKAGNDANVKEISARREPEMKPDNICKPVETEQNSETAIDKEQFGGKVKGKSPSKKDNIGPRSSSDTSVIQNESSLVMNTGIRRVVSIPIANTLHSDEDEDEDKVSEEVTVNKRWSSALPRGAAPRMQDLRGRSRTIKEKGEGSSPSSPRKSYRRLYVTHVKGSKSIDLSIDMEGGDQLDDVAELKTTMDRDDALQVQLVLKCGDLKFGTL